MSGKRRYAIVGVGNRSGMYRHALLATHAQWNEPAGYCDNNAGRLDRCVEEAARRGVKVPGYAAGDFDRMIAEQRPDGVIVTTRDCYHDLYICRAMELGCDVVTEKPMTINAEKCGRILATRRRTGRQCRVTFNYRYSPPRTQVKDLLMSGLIGEVLSVDFNWLLDTRHGADYFRRWHRNKENSGGLMVHKATHHFDLINWWLSAVPVRVFASGHRRFYTPETADRYGLKRRGPRCLDCPEAKRCRFVLDIRAHRGLKEEYLDHERHDGYIRDGCVFSDAIDIEDCMTLVVEYDTGAKMSYSLNACMPWEGYTVCINGTRGRLEHRCMEASYVSGDQSVPGALRREGTWIRIYPNWKQPYEAPVWESVGGHGGGDAPLLDDIFRPGAAADKYLRCADHRAGAYSILTGIAANISMKTGQAVAIAGLVEGLERPDYPPMPSRDEPLSTD